ncbi:MAG: UDP-glucose 6-dehydrogenase, partial [Alcanivoracaceae bacterium]
MKISVFGTGYVGLVTGACLSDVGHHVTCMDVDTAKVDGLKSGIIPIYEPGLEEIVLRNQREGRLQFT